MLSSSGWPSFQFDFADTVNTYLMITSSSMSVYSGGFWEFDAHLPADLSGRAQKSLKFFQVEKFVCSLYIWKSVWLDIKILGWHFLWIFDYLFSFGKTHYCWKVWWYILISFSLKMTFWGRGGLDAQRTFLCKIKSFCYNISQYWSFWVSFLR